MSQKAVTDELNVIDSKIAVLNAGKNDFYKGTMSEITFVKGGINYTTGEDTNLPNRCRATLNHTFTQGVYEELLLVNIPDWVIPFTYFLHYNGNTYLGNGGSLYDKHIHSTEVEWTTVKIVFKKPDNSNFTDEKVELLSKSIFFVYGESIQTQKEAITESKQKEASLNNQIVVLDGKNEEYNYFSDKIPLTFVKGGLSTDDGSETNNPIRCRATLVHTFDSEKSEKLFLVIPDGFIPFGRFYLYKNGVFFATSNAVPGQDPIIHSANEQSWNQIKVCLSKTDGSEFTNADIAAISSASFFVYEVGGDVVTLKQKIQVINTTLGQTNNSLSVLSTDVQVFETKLNPSEIGNLFDKDNCEFGYVFSQDGTKTVSPYWAISNPIYVKNHRGEYISKNKSINPSTPRYSKFINEDGSFVTVAEDGTGQILIPENAVLGYIAIYCIHGNRTDLEDACINYGKVIAPEAYNPLNSYLYNYLFYNEFKINSGDYKTTIYITQDYGITVGASKSYRVQLFGLQDAIVVFYEGANFHEITRVNGSEDGVFIEPDTNCTIIVVSLGSGHEVSEDTQFKLVVREEESISHDVQREVSNSVSDITKCLDDNMLTSIPFPPSPQQDRHSDYNTINTAYIYSIFDGLASKFPNYINATDFGPDSSGNFRVKGYRINFAATPKFKILIVCNQHGGSAGGDPVMGGYIATQFIKDICGSGHRNNSLLRWIRENVSVNIIPAANPWGIDNLDRKNYNGVNLNRNWPTSGWEDFPSVQGENYKGASAADQVETQYCLQFIQTVQPDIIIDNHTLGGTDGVYDGNSGNMIIGFPKDYTNNYTEYTTYFAKLSQLMRKEYGLRNVDYGHYASLDDDTPDLRVWAKENDYLGGLIEMNWRDYIDDEKGFTANMIEAAYMLILGIYNYYRQQ